MDTPNDHLSPVWRCEPNHGSGVFTVALDPREAAFVLDRGWASLDEIKYRVSLKGCTGNVDSDGRIMVRCEIAVEADARMLNDEADALRRHTYDAPLEVLV